MLIESKTTEHTGKVKSAVQNDRRAKMNKDLNVEKMYFLQKN
jgi:hypothetical protein